MVFYFPRLYTYTSGLSDWKLSTDICWVCVCTSTRCLRRNALIFSEKASVGFRGIDAIQLLQNIRPIHRKIHAVGSGWACGRVKYLSYVLGNPLSGIDPDGQNTLVLRGVGTISYQAATRAGAGALGAYLGTQLALRHRFGVARVVGMQLC